MVKLLHHKYKLPGIILAVAGLLLSVVYFFFNFRFELPVFAVVSSYMKTSFLTIFKTNFADETIMLLLLLGFFMWAFSEEKLENEAIWVLRARALRMAILTDLGVLLFAILFIYGSGFIAIILINMILPLILYLSWFNYLKIRGKNTTT